VATHNTVSIQWGWQVGVPGVPETGPLLVFLLEYSVMSTTTTNVVKSVREMATEATTAASAMALKPLDADRLKWLAASIATSPVLVGGKTAPDIFGGNMGSKAAAHNAVFISFPGYVVPAATISVLLGGLVFTDSRGVSAPGKYNPNHLARLVAGSDAAGTGCICTPEGVPCLAKVTGGYTLNPVWAMAHEARTGRKLAEPAVFTTPEPPKAETAPKAKRTPKASKPKK